LSKIADLNLPHLYLAPQLNVTPSEFRRDLWRQKTTIPWLSYGVVCVILRLVILVQCRLMTNRRTDRQTEKDGRTHDDSKYRAVIASRGRSGGGRDTQCLLWVEWL